MDIGIPVEQINFEDLKPKDRINGYPIGVPRWYTKIFEALPGIITWFFLLLPFIVGFAGHPEILEIYVAFLTVYWAFRGFKFVLAIFIGYQRSIKAVKTDWIGKLKEEKLPYESLKFIYLLPVVNEDLAVLEPSLETWSQSDIGSEKISVVFAMEDRFRESCMKNFAVLKAKYGHKFREFVYALHPSNIPGEVVGVKNPNINWAARRFADVVQKRGEKLDEYLLITCDSDQRPHPKYLSSIAYKYLTDPNPTRKFYSTAVHTFNNNIYRVPTLIRTFSSFLTFAVMYQWISRKKISETWSAYIVNFQTVHDVGYWDPEIPNDDTAFYYNALIRFNGDFAGEEVYVPTNNDAVENEDYLKSHHSLYKQQLRWGWGGFVLPMTLAGLYKNKSIPLAKRIRIVATMFDERLIFRTVVYLITLGLPILTLISPAFQYSSASYNLPRIMSYILTFVMFFNIPTYIIRKKVSPTPKNWKPLRVVLDALETVMVSINMLTFAFIPFIQAQTEMMLGRGVKKNHYVTEKVSIK